MRNVLSMVLVVLALAALATEAGGRRVASRQDAAAPAEVQLALPASVPSEQLIIPVAGVPASQLKGTFDEGRVGHLHHAIDILAPRGTPVLAAVDGTVRKLFLSRAGGITLYEYDRASLRSYYYAHLDRYADGLHEGQVVRRGEVLGYVGTTGNAPPQTPHLHFAIEILPPTKEWWKGTAIDPYPILAANGVTTSVSLSEAAR